VLRLPRSLWRSGSGAATSIGLLLVLLTLVLATYAVWELRREAIEGARTSAENQAYALAAHAAQVLSGSQLLADNLVQTLEDPRPAAIASAPWDGPQTHAWLRSKRGSYRWLGLLALVDARGRLVNQSEIYPPPPVELASHPAFRSAQAGRDDVLVLSVPLTNGLDNDRDFYLARRLRGPHGEFAGLLLVGVSSDYFSRFYLAQRMDRRHPEIDGTSMTLLRADLTVLARAPLDATLVGRRLPAENGYMAHDLDFPTRPVPSELTWDADPRNRPRVLVVMQRVDGFPVYVAVAQRDTVYLALWRRQAISIISFAGGMGLFISLSFYALVRLLRAREKEMRDQARLREVAEQASRAKSQFLATISHEVRTPLNGILGTAELLERTPLDAQQRGWTHALLRSGRHLLGVISDVLDLSKIEAGEMGIDPQPVGPHGLAEDVHELFTGAARAKGLQLVLSVAPQVPACVLADATRLRQVLANLVSNAVKFSDRGAVRLAVSAEGLDDRERCRLRFEVSDQGVGMPPEAQARVLAPFVQADGSVARRYGGTGLGLAICDRLLALMGSALEFSSREGEGSVFWFTLELPVCREPQELDDSPGRAEVSRYANSGAVPLDMHDPAPPAHAAAPPERLTLHVLVVEDNPVNAMVVEAQLGALGCSCEIATDGRDALHALATRRFDAVLMDCMLPTMSGYDATEAWRAQEREQGRPRTPIIALTANVMASNLQRCVDCGMDGHLTKPCTRDELEAALRQWARMGSLRPE
jgi:hypothetical protein